MFTGLVQCVGEVNAVTVCQEGKTLIIDCPLQSKDLEIGASVAVDGVCLTVTRAESRRFEVVMAFETLQCTTLGQLQVGDVVNLEPSLRVGEPLGGHMVSGHVDGVGRIRAWEARGDAKQGWVDVPLSLLRYVATKGSVTVQGVSLTVNDVDATGFTFAAIPHTLSATTLGRLAVADDVNLEVDVVARYVERLLTTAAAVPGRSPHAELRSDRAAKEERHGQE